MTFREKVLTRFAGIGIVFGVSLLCYNSLWFMIPLMPYCLLFRRKQMKKRFAEQKWKLNLQFGDALKGLSAALEAGYSVENGIAEAYRDMLVTYSEEDMIMKELRLIMGNIRNSMSVEEALSGFAKRSGLEDAEGFANVFATAQRTGGNIIALIRSTTEMVRTRIDIRREVRTATASAKFETDIMKIVPFGVLLYLRIFSPDMVMPLYGNMRGIVFMTVLLAIYVFLSEISERMVKIEL